MAENMRDPGFELGWDSAIEKDSPDFVLLPEGDYDFKVVKFERGRYEGGDKLPACNMAILDIELSDLDGNTTTVRHRLYLHSRTEGLLCAFFTAIGARKHGERIQMNWNIVLGATGRCKVGVREYTNKNGEKSKSNEIRKFYEPAERTAPAAAPTAPAGNVAYTPGRF